MSSLLLLLQPAAAILLAAVVLGEHPSPLQLAGAALVCGGILIAARARPVRTRSSRTRPASSVPPVQVGGSEHQMPVVGDN
jgi:drug/metabolite transporter (DMT)-like permease